MRGKDNKTFQTAVLQFLGRGYWIQAGFVTNGENEIMPVRKSTITSLINKGKIEEVQSKFYSRKMLK